MTEKPKIAPGATFTPAPMPAKDVPLTPKQEADGRDAPPVAVVEPTKI